MARLCHAGLCGGKRDHYLSTLTEDLVSIGISILLFVAGLWGIGYRYGMPGRTKPTYPMRKTGRFVLFLFSALFLLMGIIGLAR